MIQTNELRIGNLLYFGDEINRVYAIEENCFYVFTAEEVSLKNTTCDLKPIPLTEDILYDCGFLSFGSRFTHKKIPFDIISGDGFHMINTSYKIKYLHQLQNLYFALTGEELEIESINTKYEHN